METNERQSSHGSRTRFTNRVDVLIDDTRTSQCARTQSQNASSSLRLAFFRAVFRSSRNQCSGRIQNTLRRTTLRVLNAEGWLSTSPEGQLLPLSARPVILVFTKHNSSALRLRFPPKIKITENFPAEDRIDGRTKVRRANRNYHIHVRHFLPSATSSPRKHNEFRFRRSPPGG